jgi:threonine/homoserine/homoserine lactone efflux protein
MDAAHAILAFALAAGLLTATPGLDTALVLRTATLEGPRRGMQAAFGIGLGCLVWGAAASIGLGALLAASQVAYDALRLASVLYLLWLGGRMLVAAFRPTAQQAPRFEQTPSRSWLWRGFLTNILNPKVGVFYITFLPLFVPAHASVTAFSMLLTCIHVGEGLGWFWLLTSALQPLASWIQKGSVTRALDGLTGSVLIAFGVELFFERR